MDIITIYQQFPTDNDCLNHLEKVRWSDGPRCPYCGSDKATARPKERRYHCGNCNTPYSVTVGTIFHDTKLDLQKWFLAISLILNAKKSISARQLARDIGVNKDTAWYMRMRIRRAMVEQGSF
jgi:transposase-like protein